MSTKIFQGFQIATSSLPEVLEIVNAFRPKLEQEARQMLHQFVDTAAKRDRVNGWMLWLQLREKTVEKGIRAPSVDTEFKIVLFPEGDRFIGIAYTEQRQWFRAWLEQPKVSEYAYWNNTDDTPEGVSYEDFRKRGEVWDRVLGHSPPSMRGFSIEVTDPNGPSPYTDDELAATAADQSNEPSP